MRWRYRRPGVITIAWLAAALGLLPMPGEYYMLVRIFFCGLSIYFLTKPAGVRDVEKWVLAGVAVLYNPLVPIEVGSRAVWNLLSIATVVYFQMLNRRAAGSPSW